VFVLGIQEMTGYKKGAVQHMLRIELHKNKHQIIAKGAALLVAF
jgi:hypothetical protein